MESCPHFSSVPLASSSINWLPTYVYGGFRGGSVVKNLNGNPLHFSILVWRILWTEEPGRLQSMGSQRAGHDWACMRLCLHHAQPWTWFSDRKKQVLAGWRTLGRPSQSSHAWTNKFIKHYVQLVIASESRSLLSDWLQPQGLYSPWDSPGQNTGVGSLTLFQGIFPTQGSNLGLRHCRWILYQLSHQGSLPKRNET